MLSAIDLRPRVRLVLLVALLALERLPSGRADANCQDLASIAGYRAGVYVLRLTRGGTVLAEGRFTLV
jgi:hypothetical protein